VPGPQPGGRFGASSGLITRLNAFCSASAASCLNNAAPVSAPATGNQGEGFEVGVPGRVVGCEGVLGCEGCSGNGRMSGCLTGSTGHKSNKLKIDTGAAILAGNPLSFLPTNLRKSNVPVRVRRVRTIRRVGPGVFSPPGCPPGGPPGGG
jgi:hypothetical protein